tara:strand:- start:287 stop:475 length:189 start_codon:yes stop_codon:yes gene_type:complete
MVGVLWTVPNLNVIPQRTGGKFLNYSIMAMVHILLKGVHTVKISLEIFLVVIEPSQMIQSLN